MHLAALCFTFSYAMHMHMQAWYGQMNAAIRHVARSLMVPLVDFEQMSCTLGSNHFLRQVMHIYHHQPGPACALKH